MSIIKTSFRLAVIIILVIACSLILIDSASAATSIKHGWVALDSQNRVVLSGVRYPLSGTSGVRPIKKITNGVSTIDVKNNSVVYLSNNKLGTAQALIIGSTISGYKDAFITQFAIANDSSTSTQSNTSGTYQLLKPIPISSLKISVSNASYTGKAIIPNVIIKNGAYTLKQGADYSLSCKNNIKVGSSASVTIVGKGRYSSQVTRKFSINKASIANAAISGLKKSYNYSKKAIKPSVTITVSGRKLVKGTDYTVTYKNNTKLGTAKMTINGKGNYKGSKTANFKIIGKISKSCVGELGSCNYTGKAVKPAPEVTCNGKVLKKGRDYTLSYKNNIKLGTATVTVSGKGNYTGSVTKKFNIVKMTAGEYIARCAGAICYSREVWGGYNNTFDPATNRKVWKKVHDGVRKGQKPWYHSCTVNLMTTVRWSGYDNSSAIHNHNCPAMDRHLKNTPSKWKYLGEYRFHNAAEANKVLKPGDILWHGASGTGHTLMYIGPNMAKTVYEEYIKGTDGDKGRPPKNYIWISAHGSYKGSCQPCICGSNSLAYYQSYKVARPVGSLSKLDKTFAKVLPSLRPSIK